MSGERPSKAAGDLIQSYGASYASNRHNQHLLIEEHQLGFSYETSLQLLRRSSSAAVGFAQRQLLLLYWPRRFLMQQAERQAHISLRRWVDSLPPFQLRDA